MSKSDLTILSNQRRNFLKLFGRGSAALSVSSLVSSRALADIATPSTPTPKKLNKGLGLPFTPIKPVAADTVILAKGFEHHIVLSWGDRINAKNETFGYNNDYLAFIKTSDENNDGILWANHESTHPLFVGGRKMGSTPTKEQVIKEQMSVGGSLVRIKKENGKWKMVADDKFNRRVDGRTKIPFSGGKKIRGDSHAIGTLGNCAGGVTPWNTVLTCEENYDNFYGEAVYDSKAKNRRMTDSMFGWEKVFAYPPEHYGWVVEVDPKTGESKKHIGLGRVAHECATTKLAADGRCVVYTGDDGDNRCLYKFISKNPGSLEEGTLFVASLGLKRWIPVVHSEHAVLKRDFVDQTDVLVRCRDAAPLIGGSLLDRPEDIEIDPKTGAVFVTLTNNSNRGNRFGSILKIKEKNNDPTSLEFEFETFMDGGPTSGVACPDNMVFDKQGNLWVTNDISNRSLNSGLYEQFGNNALYYIPLSGPNAGKAFQVASSPNGSEFTGPCFSPDGKTLFLSVQHPGEETVSLDDLRSTWPDGGTSVPRPSVIAIQGPALEALVG